MKKEAFQFRLPPELIAYEPAKDRAGSRLLSLEGGTGKIEHLNFTDLPSLLHPHDLLILNDTRVIPARMFVRKVTGGRIEVLIERVLEPHRACGYMRPGKPMVPGTRLLCDDGSWFVIEGRKDNLFFLQLENKNKTWLQILDAVGRTPLPFYIERPDTEDDKERYQTVYAQKDGSVAAPTAGLHFDDVMLEKLKAQGVDYAFVTLHVGAGTFQPVRVDDIRDHKMHKEYLEVSEEICDKITAAKKNGGRIIAVGTTAVRCLETAGTDGTVKPFRGETDIFIYPGYQYKSVDALITNFHWPESTLLMLVSAFSGYQSMKQAYKEAEEKKYRFYSYGDAMFITRNPETRYAMTNDTDLMPPGGVKKVLMHSCCAPCSSDIIERLVNAGIELSLFFYNPNIHPKKEYDMRKNENIRFAEKLGIPFIDADYDVQNWFARAKGMEWEPEKGKRCSMCFDMRFERTALHAHENDFEVFTSSLGISRWKNMNQINDSGTVAASHYPGLTYWTYNWKKGGGADRMYDIAKRENFYQQEYCGCIFSLRDSNALREKQGREKIAIGEKFYEEKIALPE